MTILTRGERFKDAREVHNQHGKQTMDEVCSATGLSKSLVHSLEDDESTRSVGYDKVAKLAVHYGVSCDYLLGLSPNPTVDKDLDAVCNFTGLSVEAVEKLSFIREINSNGMLNLFNLFMSDSYITSFLLKFLQYCNSKIEYESAKTVREKEIKCLTDESNGDVAKEVQLRQSGKITITYTQADIDDLLDKCDLAEYKLSRGFLAIANKIAEKYQTSLDSE